VTYFAGIVDLSSGKNQSFQGVQSGLLGYIIGNESGFTVVVDMQGTGHSKTLYPGCVDLFETGENFTGTINFIVTSKLSNLSSWPSAFLQLDAVGIQDTINENSYPMPLPRLVNIGGSVNFVGGTATNIVNDGNAADTQIIESTVSGDVGSCVTLTNDGNLVIGDAAHHGSVKFDNNIISSNDSGTLIVANLVDNGTLIVTGDATFNGAGTGVQVTNDLHVLGRTQLENGKIVTSSSGDITIPNNVYFTALDTDGATKRILISVDSLGNTAIHAASTGHTQLKDGGNTLWTDISSGTIAQQVKGNGFEWYNNNFLPEISFFTGNGSGTYNHGFNGAGESISPFHVIPIVNEAGSATQGYDSVTTTQVHITLGAALNFKAFCV